MRLDSPVVSKLTFKPGAAVADSSFTGSFSGSYVGDGTSIEGVVYSNLASTPTGILSGSTNQARLTDISGLAVTDSGVIVGDGSNFVLESGATLRTSLGLGNLDNTSDANKPVSTAGQTALDLKANIAGPTFTGTVGGITKSMVGLGNVDNESKATMFAAAALTGNSTAVTQADNDDSTKIATTAFVMREVSDILGGAPAALDTLLELSASISNGDSDVVALTTTVGTKLAKASNLSDLADASTARTNLGLAIGTNVQAFDDGLSYLDGLNFTNEATFKAGVNLEIGTDVQGFDAQLTDVAGLAVTDGGFIVGDGSNLVLETGATARTSIGLGTTGHVEFHCLGVGTAGSTTQGEIRATNDITSFYSSDERLKENIQELDGALDKVKALRGVTFDWKELSDEQKETIHSHEGHDIGVIAQEVQAQYPELVTEREHGHLAVDYSKLTAVLIQAVKELSAKVDELSK